jgi:hypothetical protein
LGMLSCPWSEIVRVNVRRVRICMALALVGVAAEHKNKHQCNGCKCCADRGSVKEGVKIHNYFDLK